VPKHTLLSDAEEKNLLGTYSISKADLPCIKHNDPAIANLNAKSGNVIKIERDSNFGSTAFYYRLVE